MLSYTICAENRIRHIDGDWDGFARRNQAPELTAAAVLNTPLLDHVTGAAMRQLLRDLFGRARQTGQPLSVPFRCDAGDTRRYMRMHVQPLADAALRIVTETIHEVSRAAVALLERQAPRAGDFVAVCSWCKRVRVGENEWLEIEEGIERLRLFEEPFAPPITHGICDPCLATALAGDGVNPSLVPLA